MEKVSMNKLEIARRAAKGGGTLAPATSETLGGVKIGEGVNVSSDGTISVSTYTPPAYSTTEHNTGKKWLNGKDVYEVAIELPATTIGNDVETDCGTFDCEQIVDCNVLTPNSDKAYTSVTAWISENNLKIRTLSTRVTTFIVVVVKYTKVGA